MPDLYVNGEPVGSMEDALREIRDAAENNRSIEFRYADGQLLGKFAPRAGDQVEPDHIVG